MPRTTLGKRTRASREVDPDPEFLQELPAKRTRRSVRYAQVNDENEDPVATASGDQDDKENEQSGRGVALTSLALEDTPSKKRTRQISISAVNRKSTVAPITPSTPRHYDVFATTPGSTPRHRVMSVGKLSRRLTPQTPLTPSAGQTIYHKAKQLFARSADPGQLVGRDDERAQLDAFLTRCTTINPGGCIYVSGPPGTGKSAMVKDVSDKAVAGEPLIRKAYINCMSIKSSKDLYITLLDQLGGETDITESDAVVALQKLLTPKKKSKDVFLVVLDEIDHILTLDLESLYRVFEWSLQKSSRLALVGIANALDLTDRFLPRLKSRNLKPELLPFLPYTAAQVKNIITSRLKSLLPEGSSTPSSTPFFHPAAIELCSRKVSTQTGDLRRAYEICRRALDLVESETRAKYENEAKEEILQMTPSKKLVLGENNNLASAPRPVMGVSVSSLVQKSLQALTVETAPRVTIAHLNKVTAAVFSHGTNQRLRTLNLQQKATLCALIAIERRNRAAKGLAASTPLSSGTNGSTPSSTAKSSKITAPTVKTLFDAYATLCKEDSVLHPLSSSEFREVVGSLETLSLVAPVDGKTGSFAPSSGLQTPGSGKGRKKSAFSMGSGDEKRMASCVGEREIEQAVDGLGADILRSILSGKALDY
jgi:cell division control protein 6